MPVEAIDCGDAEASGNGDSGWEMASDDRLLEGN